MSSAKDLEKKIQKLTPEHLQVVEDFIEFLLSKQRSKQKRGKPRFDWAGGLSELRNQYTSVQLQHKISEWRE